MCGLTGLVSLEGNVAVDATIRRMTETLVHRGPDDSGLLIEQNVALGFRRLSILDLESTGHQPMNSADGAYTIVFNGEIFNYVELRGELESRGHRFRSSGDTEVLIAAYTEWGAECLPRLNGMWAFLILDRRRNCIFGSRDRFGIKPLFMHRSRGQVLFGSEIKAIRASGLVRDDLDWGIIADFLVRQRLDESARTFFAGIEQIAAGSAFELDMCGNFRQWRYWSIERLSQATGTDPIDEYARLFEDAVRLRMRSDVPLGVFLSGGVDSSSILCALARVRLALPPEQREPLRALAFMDPRYDETRFIADTIRQTGAELEAVPYDSSDIWGDLPRVLWHHDQPVHSPTALIGFRLSQVAAERGLKVILNGQGADETAAGYPSYFEPYWQTLLSTQGPLALWRDLEDHVQLWGGSPARLFLSVLRSRMTGLPYRFAAYRRSRTRLELGASRRHPWFTPDFLAHLEPPEERRTTRSDLNMELRRSVEQTPLPLYLRIEDRNSMAHSVEIRVPFLDYRLVSLLFSLPGELKMKGAYNKYLVRQAMRGRIPDSVRDRHEKMGFPSPAGAWMSELAPHLQEVLMSSTARDAGIFDLGRIRHDMTRHNAGQVDLGRELFDVLQFVVWLQAVGSVSQSTSSPPSPDVA